jgi:hypothetical protein
MIKTKMLPAFFAANGDPHNFALVEVPGDGDCLFHSLSYSLTGALGLTERLRRMSRSALKQEAKDVQAVLPPQPNNNWGDGDDIERLERIVDIKCLLVSTTNEDPRFADGLPRILTTAFGDDDDGDHAACTYVMLAYDEGSHFRPITYIGRGSFRLSGLPWMARALAARTAEPLHARVLRAAGCEAVLSRPT